MGHTKTGSGLDLVPVIDAKMEGENKKEKLKGKHFFNGKIMSHIQIQNEHMSKILFNSLYNGGICHRFQVVQRGIKQTHTHTHNQEC